MLIPSTSNFTENEEELLASALQANQIDLSVRARPLKRQRKPIRIGIYMRIAAGLCVLGLVSFRKLIPGISAMEYTFDRAFCSLVLQTIYLYSTEQFEVAKRSFETKIVPLSAIGCFAEVLYFIALLSLSVTDAITIVAMRAIFKVILGSYMRRESPPIIEKLLSAISFAGIFFIVRPSFIFGPEVIDSTVYTGLLPRYVSVMLALCSVVISSFIQISLREIQRRRSSLVITFYFNLAIVILLGAYFIISGSHKALSFQELIMIIGSSIFHLGNFVLIEKALQLEKPRTVRLVGYTNLLASPIIDLVIFGAFPSVYTLLGATLIVGSCIKLLLLRPE